mgnify:FL=1
MTSSAEPRRVLSVHAHPDDEASKGSALVARLVSEGVGATLVCCTGGERGDINNPALQHPHIEENLAEIRAEELAKSAAIIGYDTVELLGYVDSGMADSEHNADPHNFANAPLDEAVERLVRIIRRDRPQVLLGYSDDQGGYPHPDHLRAHDVTLAAYFAAGDETRYPEAGAPFAPTKLYYSVWAKARVLAIREACLARGMESPYDEEWLKRFNQDHRITTRVDVGDWYHVRDAALLAHATQIDPAEKFWFALSPAEAAVAYPWDDLILAHSEVEVAFPESHPFEGL